MKKKLGASLIAALMMMGLFGAASATAAPGPNGSNDKGLCTAYFNGQKKGHNKDGKASPGPFAALEREAGAAEGDSRDEIASMVNEWCLTMAGGDGVEIGGNPDANGRWTCADGADDDFSCTDNPDKGKPA